MPSWQWQLTGEVDLAVDAQVFVLDPFATTSAVTTRLVPRRIGGPHRRLVCYLDAGGYEPGRPDATRFPVDVLGAPTVTPGGAAGGTGGMATDGGPDAPTPDPVPNPAGGRASPATPAVPATPAAPGAPAAGTRWLDVRRWDVLRPIVADRLRLCLNKRFDAVAFGRVDGYRHQTGFPLTADDQLTYDRRLADLAHSMSLSAGLVDDPTQAPTLEPAFDFAITQECVRYRQCDRFTPFTAAHKPVLHVEYADTKGDFCPATAPFGFSSIRKNRSLDAWRAPCPR